jgi:4-diphosphocytidyl-2-C-methyl-D-erythritol kinase
VYIPLHGRRGQLILKAPAKVNLHLEIKGRRPDGYHEILSIVHSVQLYDRVYLRSLKDKKILRILCDPPLPGQSNIAATAAQLFTSTCGIEAGIEVCIEKRIPVGAGLGGGSSDAAAVLVGLNKLLGTRLSKGELHEMAAGLGSDVPFFLEQGAALMSGRGEELESLEPREDLILVLVSPDFSISTGEAYRWFDMAEKIQRRKSISRVDLKARLRQTPPASWDFFNSFQPVVEDRYPQIKTIAGELKDCGADFAALSGSGSTIFGVFTDGKVAQSACRRMQHRVSGPYPCKFKVQRIKM